MKCQADLRQVRQRVICVFCFAIYCICPVFFFFFLGYLVESQDPVLKGLPGHLGTSFNYLLSPCEKSSDFMVSGISFLK